LSAEQKIVAGPAMHSVGGGTSDHPVVEGCSRVIVVAVNARIARHQRKRGGTENEGGVVWSRVVADGIAQKLHLFAECDLGVVVRQPVVAAAVGSCAKMIHRQELQALTHSKRESIRVMTGRIRVVGAASIPAEESVLKISRVDILSHIVEVFVCLRIE